MTTVEIDRGQISSLMKAVRVAGPLDHLRLDDQAFVEFAAALRDFMGGPLESVDAFLTEIPDTSASSHRVFWLRSNTIGSLVVQAHSGVEGERAPAEVAGWIRHLSSVRQVEILKAKFNYPPFGGREIPEVRPTVRLQFDDDEIVVVVAVSDRVGDAARDQANNFVSQLLDNLAAVGKA